MGKNWGCAAARLQGPTEPLASCSPRQGFSGRSAVRWDAKHPSAVPRQHVVRLRGSPVGRFSPDDTFVSGSDNLICLRGETVA